MKLEIKYRSLFFFMIRITEAGEGGLTGRRRDNGRNRIVANAQTSLVRCPVVPGGAGPDLATDSS